MGSDHRAAKALTICNSPGKAVDRVLRTTLQIPMRQQGACIEDFLQLVCSDIVPFNKKKRETALCWGRVCLGSQPETKSKD